MMGAAAYREPPPPMTAEEALTVVEQLQHDERIDVREREALRTVLAAFSQLGDWFAKNKPVLTRLGAFR